MKKIILLGPPSAGKTSIRKFFFEDTPIAELLKPLSLEPTIGVSWHNYELYNTKIGVVDTSGQEILNISSEEYIFIGADAVIFIFDVLQFQESKLLQLEFINYLVEIVARRDVLEENYDIYVFVHKMDVVEQGKVEETKSKISSTIIKGMKDKFGSDMRLKINFTSINKAIVDSTYNLLKNIVQSG